VRAFPDEFGVHFLCSDRVIPMRAADELVARMPQAAMGDFAEWAPPQAGGEQFQSRLQFSALLQKEFSVDALMPRLPDSPSLTDDRPVNEYYLYRQWVRRNTVSAGQESR
jgi:hypothetical protein